MKLQTRVKDLFPDDPTLSSFSQRFKAPNFDATAIRLIVSPTQMRPKARALPIVEVPSQQQEDTPSKSNAPFGNSPKRPLPLDDSDTDGGRPRKAVRGESPLKGAAGRRLDQQKRNRQNDTPQHDAPSHFPPPQPPLGNLITFLLSILPKGNTYHTPYLQPNSITKMLRDTHVPTHESQLPQRHGTRAPSQYTQSAHHQAAQPPPPIPYTQHMQHPQYQAPPQHMPSMPPLPQQYGQYNGGYPAFPCPAPQQFPTFRSRAGPQRDSIVIPGGYGTYGALTQAIACFELGIPELPQLRTPGRRMDQRKLSLAAYPARP